MENIPISLLDLILAGFGLHTKKIVEFRFCYHIERICGTTLTAGLGLGGSLG